MERLDGLNMFGSSRLRRVFPLELHFVMMDATVDWEWRESIWTVIISDSNMNWYYRDMNVGVWTTSLLISAIYALAIRMIYRIKSIITSRSSKCCPNIRRASRYICVRTKCSRNVPGTSFAEHSLKIWVWFHFENNVPVTFREPYSLWRSHKIPGTEDLKFETGCVYGIPFIFIVCFYEFIRKQFQTVHVSTCDMIVVCDLASSQILHFPLLIMSLDSPSPSTSGSDQGGSIEPGPLSSDSASSCPTTWTSIKSPTDSAATSTFPETFDAATGCIQWSWTSSTS